MAFLGSQGHPLYLLALVGDGQSLLPHRWNNSRILLLAHTLHVPWLPGAMF